MKPGRKGLKPPNGDMDPKFCKGVRCRSTRKKCPRNSRLVVDREGCCVVNECVKSKPDSPVKIPPTTIDAVESAVIDEKKDMIAAVFIKELEDETSDDEEEIEEEEEEEEEEGRNYTSQWIMALVLIVVLSSAVIAVTLPKGPKKGKDSK